MYFPPQAKYNDRKKNAHQYMRPMDMPIERQAVAHRGSEQTGQAEGNGPWPKEAA
ncbi:hypothetical protein FC91_GL002519 [Schleiferilactobacillus harbinensis DSM 16991]|uniref:Uncharacterized protein n=1 Tax=Schleiferilactobacillus harbinensis DSM 16991 TaxID=1122147 RepID=A0A0R1XBM6_9LACO|nr:hypothetical protein FC91_GL002519 [Schleiferilactobacillus harbinensis DSM 16991]